MEGAGQRSESRRRIRCLARARSPRGTGRVSHPVFVPAPSRRRGAASDPKPATWGERIAALRYIPPLGRLIWGTHRGFAPALLILRILRSLAPVAPFWVRNLVPTS